jgi:uncharacterized membrane protein YqiK
MCHLVLSRDVNKARGHKAKAKAKASRRKAKAKAKASRRKAKAKAKARRHKGDKANAKATGVNAGGGLGDASPPEFKVGRMEYLPSPPDFEK